MKEWDNDDSTFWETVTPDKIKEMLESGKKADARIKAAFKRGVSGMTPLHDVARRSPYPEIVSIFVNAGANINARTAEGFTPLHTAIKHCEELEMVVAILENGANPNARDENGKTPLHLATQKHHLTPELFVTTLLDKGADGTLRDSEDKIPFDYVEGNKFFRYDENCFYITDAYWELRESYWALKEQERNQK